MLPHFAITLFSGVRPNECLGLTAADIHLDSARPGIEVNRAKGGRGRRIVEISPTLVAILTRCAEKQLAPGFFSKRKFNRIRHEAGVYERWTKDISRHSYASYTYELDRDINSLAKNMGNSAKVLFTNYIRAVRHEQAEAYVQLAPKWKAPRRVSMEGKRTDLWEKLRPELLNATQRRLLAARKAREKEANFPILTLPAPEPAQLAAAPAPAS